jgi:hypothetical protein
MIANFYGLQTKLRRLLHRAIYFITNSWHA